MKIYKLDAAVNEFEIIVPADDNWEPFQFHGTPIGERWMPVEVEPLTEQNLPVGDFPGLTTRVPVFSQHALDVLRPLLSNHGEILPLTCPQRQLFAFNPTEVVEVLDEEKSEVKRFVSSGRIMRIIRYAFHHHVALPPIFKIPQLRAPVFVAGEFRDLVMSNGLTGFKFELLGSSGE